MKKLLKTLFAAGLTLTMMVTPILAKDVTLTFNGEVLKPAVAPFIENGTTFIPLRIVADNLGAKTDYYKEANNQYIKITKADIEIILAVNAEEGYPKVNGETIDFKVLPKIVNGTAMVPVRFVSENLGCTITFDAETKTVIIVANETAAPADTEVPTEDAQVDENAAEEDAQADENAAEEDAQTKADENAAEEDAEADAEQESAEDKTEAKEDAK